MHTCAHVKCFDSRRKNFMNTYDGQDLAYYRFITTFTRSIYESL